MRTAIVAGVGFLGVIAGVAVAVMYLSEPRQVRAASNDRYQDYVLATGAVSLNPRVQSDGVWMLDYRTGKLLGTVIDKSVGKIVGWAEVDLASEFAVEPRQDVHFLMTTGYVTQGQSALYVAETTTGKFGIYTMGPGPNGSGIVIRRHDMTTFRAVSGAAPELPIGPVPVAGAPAAGVPVIDPQPLPPTPNVPNPVIVPEKK